MGVDAPGVGPGSTKRASRPCLQLSLSFQTVIYPTGYNGPATTGLFPGVRWVTTISSLLLTHVN